MSTFCYVSYIHILTNMLFFLHQNHAQPARARTPPRGVLGHLALEVGRVLELRRAPVRVAAGARRRLRFVARTRWNISMLRCLKKIFLKNWIFSAECQQIFQNLWEYVDLGTNCSQTVDFCRIRIEWSSLNFDEDYKMLFLIKLLTSSYLEFWQIRKFNLCWIFPEMVRDCRKLIKFLNGITKWVELK